MKGSDRGGSAISNRFGFRQTAFTLIELLVVIVTLGILAVMLLPALAGTQVQSKTTACTARFRQWAASANLYANDHQGWLPVFDPAGGGSYIWDVGTGMLNALYPYGMDVPDYFCPMRPAAWDAANTWGRANLAHPIRNTTELTAYFSRLYPQECQLQDAYWVPRYNGTFRPPNPTLFPPDYSRITIKPYWITVSKPTSLPYGWPQRLHDIAVPYVPFVSDSAGSGQGGGLNSPNPASTNLLNMAPGTAHFINGTLIGVNLAFADGHVITHTPDQMRAAYSTGANFWFY
jgi:prepilin-type N-terminal cleavage/methylation domain-containing protein/prepilin-type processing-associated H-X9-DG protein